MSKPSLILGWILVLAPPIPAQNQGDEFLFGATVYPEFLTLEQQQRMLDEFQRARMNVVRVGESSWGTLEPAPGKRNYAWLRAFLDELSRRKIKAILGTGTYIPPQWLTGGNREILIQPQPGVAIHSMYRHTACLNHPLYRGASLRYIRDLAAEFKDHPEVIAWQLDNEVEFLLNLVCYNPACEHAWKEWLKKTYVTPEEMNRRLYLESWGMQVSSLDDVAQPSKSDMGDAPSLPSLTLVHRRFRRDTIAGFLREQREALRKVGVRQPITHDFIPNFTTTADDPSTLASLDISSFNFYPPVENAASAWLEFPWYEDVQRSALGLNHFWVTEARFGNAAKDGTSISEPSPTRDQIRMWCMQSTALGATMLMFWSGNRWRGGHWPHWGGLLDWTGQPEPDFEWAFELGKFYAKWGKQLIESPVVARAAVLTDFDQRLALNIYPHVTGSSKLIAETFDALHRLGIGVDSITAQQATNAANLSKYSLIIIPAATALDGPELPAALEPYVLKGGKLVILPLTAYQDGDGVFRGDGFGANLSGLTGTLVRTVRRVGSARVGDAPPPRAVWSSERGTGTPAVTWAQIIRAESPIGMDGFCEFVEVKPRAEVIARFENGEGYLKGRPAATVRNLGEGSVFHVAFWPGDDTLLRLYSHLLGGAGAPLKSGAPKGVLAVPRADGSMFLVNTGEKASTIQLTRPATNRISGEKFPAQLSLGTYGAVWLE